MAGATNVLPSEPSLTTRNPNAGHFEMEIQFGTSRLKVPDFIIGGAMKSGTTSIHRLLSSHRDVFIPAGELQFFDIDEIQGEGEYIVYTCPRWEYRDFELQLEKNIMWYSSFFSERKEALLGEDATGYLTSKNAPERISRLLPNVKLIFILRNPVDRAYSHYWHRFRTARARYGFEQTLNREGTGIYRRSIYVEDIRRYLAHISRDRIFFALFEELKANPQALLRDICSFLDLDGPDTIDYTLSRANRSYVPAVPLWVQGISNSFRHRTTPAYFRKYLPPPIAITGSPRLRHVVSERINCFVAALGERGLNLAPKRPYPPMLPETRRFLTRLFARENRGLAQLIDKDLGILWGPEFSV